MGEVIARAGAETSREAEPGLCLGGGYKYQDLFSSNSKCGNSSQYEPLPIINGLRGLDKSRALLYNVAGS